MKEKLNLTTTYILSLYYKSNEELVGPNHSFSLFTLSLISFYMSIIEGIVIFFSLVVVPPFSFSFD